MTLCEPTLNTENEGLPALPEGVPPLTSFYLYLTEGCNLRCQHCWVAPAPVDGKPSPGEYLELDLLKKAVEEAKPLGLRNAKLTGGEPTLHPDFVEIVDYLAREGIRSTMETNATLIDADLARHLKEETNVYFISVSIDGPDAEVHDAFRGVKGAFDDAVRGFRHLVDAGYKPQLIMSLHRGNVEYVEEVVELAVSLGAGSVKFNPVTPTGRGVAMHERGDALGFEEVMELAHRVRGEIQKGSPTALIFETPLALYAVGELIQREKLGVCHVLNILGILGSGDMALCGIGRTIPELCYGSLRETGVREVWLHHPTLQELRDEVNGEYPAPCGSCLHVHRCQTFCVAQNYQRSGKLTSPDWLCAEAYRQGVFPVSRLKGTS